MNTTVQQLMTEFIESSRANAGYWLSLRLAGAFDNLPVYPVTDEEKIEFLDMVNEKFPLI